MEQILKELMNTKCVSMHNSQFRCYEKKCDGQCAMFISTLFKLENFNKNYPKESKEVHINLGLTPVKR